MTKESEKQKERFGETITTSVSVSKQFQEILNQYNFSPTEAFRRGIAVMLYDEGVEQYQTEINEKRFEYVKKFMEVFEKDEKLKEEYEKMKLFENIKKNFIKIKKLIEEIEND